MSGTVNQKKNRKILVVLAVALICAVAAACLIIAYLTPKRTTVYVFREDYAAGTPLSTSMLTPVQADSKIIMAGSSTNTGNSFVTASTYESIVTSGATLKTDVNKGLALMPSMLSTYGGNEVEIRMDSSSIAVTVPISNITGVTSSLKAESHVNVYVTYNAGGTYLLLENMRVLAVSKGDSGLSGVTLELHDKEASLLIDAINSGTIHLGLVNETGYVYATTTDEPQTEE